MDQQLLFFFLLSCSCGHPGPDASMEQAIRNVMDVQQKAWNDGDVHTFMAGYANDICFMGSGGLECGRDQVEANYKRSYPDDAAMGELRFDIWQVDRVDQDHAWCAGLWILHRSADTLQGRFSLLWELREGQWSIIRDHSDLDCTHEARP